MAVRCINKNTAEYKELSAALNNPMLANSIMVKWQDANNTENLPTVAEAMEYHRANKTLLNAKKKDFAEAVYGNLRRLGIIGKKYYGDHYLVSSDQNTREFNPFVRQFNKDRLFNYLRINNIPKESIQLSKTIKGNGVKVKVLNNVFTPKDIMSQSRGFNTPHSREVVRHLMRMFPDTNVLMLSVSDARKLYESIDPSQKGKVAFNDINSFYYDGNAILIKGRVTDDTMVEEILHPFVDAIYVDNPDLFNGLLKESKESFPELWQQVQELYSNKKGFLEKHRELEQVTQALSRHFSKENKENGTKKFKDRVKEFLNWFFDLISDLNEYLTGRKLTAKQISPTTSMTSIAKLLNTEGIQFKLDKVVDRGVRYSLTDGAKKAYDKAYAQGNAAQKEIIQNLFHGAIHSKDKISELAASSLEDGDPLLVLDEATHTYQDLNDLTSTWKSTTEGIKGPMSKENKEKYELNTTLGNDFDNVMNGLAAGLSLQEIESNMEILTPEQVKKAYDTMQENLEEYLKQGSLSGEKAVALPQVVVYDKATGYAGTIDVLIVMPDGTLKIVDLKTSKKSIDEYNYLNQSLNYDKGWDLSEESQIRKKLGTTRLSTRQQHNTQVNVYRRMLENMGYVMSKDENATSTFHLKVGIKGKGKDQKFTGQFDYDGWSTHELGQNEEYVDALVPRNIDVSKQEKVKKAMGKGPSSTFTVNLEESEKEPENAPVAPEYNVITNALKSYQMGLIKRQDVLNTTNKQVYLDGHQTTEQLQGEILNSISAINIALGSGPQARSRIFSALMRDALRQIERFQKYIEDPKNFNSPEYISYVLSFDDFLSTFEGLYTLQDSSDLNGTQKALVLRMQTRANAMMGTGTWANKKEGVIDKAITDYVRTLIKNESSRNFTDKELDELMRFGEDIGVIELQTKDLATSRDTILAVMDKIYKYKKQELLDKIDQREKRIKKHAAKLQKLSPEKDPQKMYDWMLDEDGRYVQEIGPQYYEEMKKLRAPLMDAQGSPKEYRDITDLKSASIEDIEYNIQLAEDKEKFADFFRAETIGVNDQPTGGNFHYYTEEFINERKKFQYFTASGKNGYWSRKSNVSDKQYERFMAKYFRTGIQQDAKTIALRDQNGNFTGEVKHDIIFPTVKNEYRKRRGETLDGRNMRSEKYDAIYKDTTALGQARREFYEMFREVFEDDLLKKLPKNTRDQMLGRVPLIRGRLGQDLKAKPSIITTLFGKTSRGIKNLFRTTAQQRTILTDESGDLVNSMPIYYTGRARDDEQLTAIDAEIANLKQDRADGKIRMAEYQEKLEQLQGTRASIESKPSTAELNRDMGNGLLKFASMAEHYETMGSVEDTMNAMLKQLEKRTYTGSDPRVKKGVKGLLGFEEKATIKGSDSNVLRRAKKWMDMVYYDHDQLTKGFWEKVSDGLIQLSSLSYVAFNPFGNFNNYVLGRVNDNIEAIGGRFYSKEAYARASMEYNKRAVPDMIKRLASSKHLKKLGGNRADYDPEYANSKYEAFVDEFRMMDSDAEIRESGSEIDRIQKSWFRRKMEWGYVLQDAAEWNVQTKVGIAMIMDTRIRNNDTGEILSLYDAMNFDAETKGLKLKEGFTTIVEVDETNLDENGNPKIIRELEEYAPKTRYRIRNQIREVNKQIHGNYAYEDRMVMQSSTVGKLAAQFHKWVAPAARARFQREYYDENLGWMEGRYRSWWKFMSYSTQQLAKGDLNFKKYAAGFLEDNGYLEGGDIQDNQKALNSLQGFYRTMGEIGIMMLTFALKSLMMSMWSDDDDSSEIEARLENVMMYQADRTFKELILFVPLLGTTQQYQMMKSPIASTRTLGELGEALTSSIITPWYGITQSGKDFYANSDVVYQRGRRKGKLKLTKEWQDALPILYSIKKWNNYLDMRNFFIK